MFKDLPPNLVAAVAAINQTSRAAFVVEQHALRNKKLMQPPMPKQPAPKADPAAHPGAKKMAEAAEGATMSRAAKGHEKYGKEGMQALAKAGRDGKDLTKIRDKYNKYDESMAEAIEGSIPKTPKEKELAAKYGHPKRITFGDVLKARGVTRQEATLHPNQQKLDVHEPEKDELTAKDFKMLRAMEKDQNGKITKEDMHKAGKKDGKMPKLTAGGVKEEVEELDELSKTTLGSYAKKASRDAVITRKIGADFEHQGKRAKSPGMKAASDELSQKYKSKSWQRRDGVDKAVDRLTKEEVEQVDEAGFDPLKHIKNPNPAVKAAAKDVKRGSYADRAALMKAGGVKDDRGPRGVTQEEVEQVDELNKDTLYSYAQKSNKDMEKKHKELAVQVRANKSVEANRTSAKLSNRDKGLDRAEKRLNKEEVEQTQEGWNDMMQASQTRAEKEKTAKGTGKFNKQVVSTGTVYTRKASTFDDGGGKDADERKVDRTRRNALKQEAFTPSLSFKYYVEATGPNHLHVSDAGNNKYKVHSVGSNFSNGIKVGEHLTDTHLDDFADMGGKITHVKPTAPKAQPK